MSTQVEQRRRINDTIKTLSVTMQSANESGVLTAEDLTGMTVEFSMVNAADGTVKIAQTGTGVAVDNAAAGQVTYTFSASGVDTAGIFWGSFVAISGGAEDTYPAKHLDLRILIGGDGQSAEQAYQAAIG